MASALAPIPSVEPSQTDHRPLTLAHVVTVPLSLRFLSGQVRFMHERGYQVHVVSSGGQLLDDFVTQEPITAHVMNLTRAISPLVDARQLLKLYKLFRRLRPDIVHAHTPKGSLLGIIGAWFADVPVRIYQARGLRLSTTRGPLRWLLTLTERVTCALATDVLCNSHSLKAEFVGKRLSKSEKTSVLLHGSGNGIDLTNRFHKRALPADVRLTVRNRHEIPGSALVVGFVGRIVRDKGIIELLAAWRGLRGMFPTAHLMLVGPYDDTDPIPPSARVDLESDPRVHRIPFTENVAEYYAAMDLFVLPSYREGFANALLEAGAMELASVTTTATGCIDAIDDGRTGTIVPFRDATALKGAIERYLRAPTLLREHGAAARAHVERHYRQQPLWSALESFYQQARTRPRQVGWRLAVKQCFDKIAASWLLVVTSPLLGATALVVATTLGRPVLFTQPRLGRGGKVFRVFKFRTMTDKRDAAGKLLPDQARLTKVGRALRSFSLDELPQLFNVIRGEMSLVGPRPLLVQYLERYSPEQARRHSVLPGITGWAAVHGRNALTWEKRFDLDVWYVDHWSLRLDLEILLRTLIPVLKRQGISQPNHATQSEFMGSPANMRASNDSI